MQIVALMTNRFKKLYNKKRCKQKYKQKIVKKLRSTVSVLSFSHMAIDNKRKVYLNVEKSIQK